MFLTVTAAGASQQSGIYHPPSYHQVLPITYRARPTRPAPFSFHPRFICTLSRGSGGGSIQNTREDTHIRIGHDG